MLFSKYLNKYYLKYFIFYALGILALLAVDYVQLYVPEFLGELVETVSGGNANVDMIADTIKSIVIIAVVICLGRVTWRLTIFRASSNIESDLRHEMFNKAERLSQSYYHNNKVGSIMAWFTNDLENIEEFLGWGCVMMIDALFLGVSVSYKMFKLDWAMTLLAFVPVLLIVLWGALVEKFMAQRWEHRQKCFDEMYDFAQENFSGIRVIKAFVKETQELHAFAKVAKKNEEANISFVKLSVIFDVLIELIIGVIVALIIGFGSYFVYCVSKGNPCVIFNHEINITAGKLVTFIGYFDALIWPLIAMGQIVSMRSRSKTSLKRIEAFLDEKEDIVNPENAIVLDNVQGEIRYNHFTFAYPDSEVKYLNDITLTIKPGELVGVVGKVGSGKTTLVNALFRLYNIDKGSIFIDGNDIMDVNVASLRDSISYAPQDNFLFSDKIANNINFSNKKVSRDVTKSAAAFADVDGNIMEFKDGYDTVVGERGTTLSGGQKQRISIARAYIKNAPIMVMDDSVSAVDTKTEEVILNNIHERRKGKTTILIASRVSTVAKCDKIIVLNDGNLEAFDTPERLLEISPTYQKMVYLQKLENEVNEKK